MVNYVNFLPLLQWHILPYIVSNVTIAGIGQNRQFERFFNNISQCIAGHLCIMYRNTLFPGGCPGLNVSFKNQWQKPPGLKLLNTKQISGQYIQNPLREQISNMDDL